ncbi:TPA: hypothetical protein N0F65_001790 [Lagenidium giganteum]|uniref:Uncharacterized protein n=1 Tax=Lagenidium giganteum TaxID=4803 RepID=A0AAV2Z6B4_9STRA|nr:TPA: hypothetical protein N0F65_001790 [Lagenidium giganteum]
MASFPFPIASGKKKPVQVFTCPEETWKNRAPKKATVAKADDKDKDGLSLTEEIRKEFEDTLTSVKEFAAANLTGKEKKQYDAKKIEALGGKAAKNRNMPYNMLIGLKKASAVREKRREVKEKESGVVSGKRKVSASAAAKEKKKKTKVDYGIQATKGKFKNGVLNVKGL